MEMHHQRRKVERHCVGNEESVPSCSAWWCTSGGLGKPVIDWGIRRRLAESQELDRWAFLVYMSPPLDRVLVVCNE